MSDDGGGRAKAGYKFEYASTGRAMCKGPKPCNGTKLEKGTFRLGVVSDFRGHPTTSYRHYGCITKKVWQNMKGVYSNVEDIEGFDVLTEGDKAKVRTAWEDEAVAAEDIPPSAVAGAEDDSEAPKKKPGRPRKKQKTDDDDGSDEPRPKKKAAPRRKKKADSDDDADVSPSDDEGGSDYGSGKKRKRGAAKKNPKKKGEDDDY